jgi:hypothetical protein
MKCSNPDCNRGIGLVAYQRGWFSKRRYCSKHCRDAFVANAPKGGGLNGSTQLRISRTVSNHLGAVIALMPTWHSSVVR